MFTPPYTRVYSPHVSKLQQHIRASSLRHEPKRNGRHPGLLMKRFIVSTALLLAGLISAADARAQGGTAPSPSRFDLGAYAGGSWTSSWLEVKDQSFPVGFHPIFGAFATSWVQPRFGLRLHSGYIPATLPEPSETQLNADAIQDGRILNIWLYDLDLMYRPFAERVNAARWLSSMYFFAGGGGLTANVAGESDPRTFPEVDPTCVFPYSFNDACLSYNPEYATVGQGTLGAGLTLFPLTDRLGLFGELGLHVYDSPFHIRPNAAREPDACGEDCVGRDVLAFTPRLVAGLLVGTGGRRPPAPVLPPPPPPPPPPVPVEEPIRLCVLVNDVPRYVDATVAPETGDTSVVVNGERRPFAAVYPPGTYAESRPFFVNNEPVPFAGRRYVRFGLPRTVAPGDLTRIGEYQGVGLFAETGAANPPQFLYLPARPNCEYQPYQLEEEVRRVRG